MLTASQPEREKKERERKTFIHDKMQVTYQLYNNVKDTIKDTVTHTQHTHTTQHNTTHTQTQPQKNTNPLTRLREFFSQRFCSDSENVNLQAQKTKPKGLIEPPQQNAAHLWSTALLN